MLIITKPLSWDTMKPKYMLIGDSYLSASPSHYWLWFLQSRPTPILMKILIMEFSEELAPCLSKLQVKSTSALIPLMKLVTLAISLALQATRSMEHHQIV